MSETWSDDWDDRLATPPPLPSYPGSSASASPDADAHDANRARWSLVSLDGRATMRIPNRFVIGSGACCDLCLTERGIALHHAMVTVEDGVAYVIALSDAPSLLDGHAIVGRERLHRDAVLTFGAATFRVEQEGLLEAPETAALAQVAGAAAASHHATPHAPHPPRIVAPHIVPEADPARSAHRAGPVRPRKRKTRFAVVPAVTLIAVAAWWVPRDFTDTRLPQPLPTPVPPVQQDALPREAPDTSTAAAMAEPTTPLPLALAPPPATAPPADDAAEALLSDADALYAKGDLVTPRGRNAAELYVRVLRGSSESKVARERLDQIVGRVAVGAEDMILRQRFDAARRSMEQLATAVPQRALVGKLAQGRWRVVDLLLQADALMQQYRLVAPDDPNAVALLREALRLEPHNGVADEMLSKAYGLLEVRRNQDDGVVSTLP